MGRCAETRRHPQPGPGKRKTCQQEHANCNLNHGAKAHRYPLLIGGKVVASIGKPGCRKVTPIQNCPKSRRNIPGLTLKAFQYNQ
jgi:hypothetical protein